MHEQGQSVLAVDQRRPRKDVWVQQENHVEPPGLLTRQTELVVRQTRSDNGHDNGQQDVACHRGEVASTEEAYRIGVVDVVQDVVAAAEREQQIQLLRATQGGEAVVKKFKAALEIAPVIKERERAVEDAGKV